MPYNVLGGQEVLQLAKRRPVDLATLSTVDGMSDTKLANYGAEILQVGVSCRKFLGLLFWKVVYFAIEGGWFSVSEGAW